MTAAAEWGQPAELEPLQGDERFIGLDASVVDFWRFALSDLRMNNARGYFAEYLVSRALGVDVVRVEWDDVDVIWGTVKIEVKSSAFVQSWPQQRPSRITFGNLRGRRWDAVEGRASEATYKADVYVFAWQTTLDPAAYAPLDVGAWSFHVLSRRRLDQLGVKSISLSRLESLGSAAAYPDLRAAIVAAAGEQGSVDTQVDTNEE